MRKIIVDTDPGVDDAAALIWLLSQSHYPITPLGIVTVAGNTSLANATNNAQLILSWLTRPEIPVIPGAAEPLAVTPSSTGMLIHGPDGLWYLGLQNLQPALPEGTPSASEFYCAQLSGHEAEVLVLTLGPLTNLAQTIASGCSVDWSQVKITSLGGAKSGGNQTPVTEANFFLDPEAASQVLASGAQITLVTLDGFGQFTLETSMLKLLENAGVPAMRALMPALQLYRLALSDGDADPALPDPVAAIVALDHRLGLGKMGLVKVVPSAGVPEFVRGQTVIALDLLEWPTLAATDAEISAIAQTVFADPLNPDYGYLLAAIGEIIAANPPNAMVVTDIEVRRLQNIFIQGVTRPPAGANAPSADAMGEQGGSSSAAQDGQVQEYFLYLPGIQGAP